MTWNLTTLQQDALMELLNIDCVPAATSLSQLAGHSVRLEVTNLTIHSVDEVIRALEAIVDSVMASVHQTFAGEVDGDAFLMLDQNGASSLKELLTNEPALSLSIDASAREVITEVGNILLTACLGAFSSTLNVPVSFSVPHLSLDRAGAILESLRAAHEGIRYVLFMHARFKVRETEVRGFLVIALNMASLDRLIREVEARERQNL